MPLGGAGRLRRSQMSDVWHLGDEEVDELRIPLCAGAGPQGRNGLVPGHAGPIWPVVDQVIEGVADGDDPRQERDLITPKAIGVTATIEAFVMVPDDRLQAQPGVKWRDDVGADLGMLLHPLRLAGVERTALEQDCFGDSDLAD